MPKEKDLYEGLKDIIEIENRLNKNWSPEQIVNYKDIMYVRFIGEIEKLDTELVKKIVKYYWKNVNIGLII